MQTKISLYILFLKEDDVVIPFRKSNQPVSETILEGAISGMMTSAERGALEALVKKEKRSRSGSRALITELDEEKALIENFFFFEALIRICGECLNRKIAEGIRKLGENPNAYALIDATDPSKPFRHLVYCFRFTGEDLANVLGAFKNPNEIILLRTHCNDGLDWHPDGINLWTMDSHDLRALIHGFEFF